MVLIVDVEILCFFDFDVGRWVVYLCWYSFVDDVLHGFGSCLAAVCFPLLVCCLPISFVSCVCYSDCVLVLLGLRLFVFDFCLLYGLVV